MGCTSAVGIADADYTACFSESPSQHRSYFQGTLESRMFQARLDGGDLGGPNVQQLLVRPGGVKLPRIRTHLLLSGGMPCPAGR